MGNHLPMEKSKGHEESDDSLAVRRARWLMQVVTDGGSSVTADELDEHVRGSTRDSHGWVDVGAFRRSISAEDVTMTGIRADGDRAVIDVRTVAGLRLERVLAVDAEGRIASIVTRLAGGPSMTMVSAAAWRAAHRSFDDPVILDDTYAEALVGDASPYQVDAVKAGSHGTQGLHYRWNMAARARLAEDTLAEQRAAAGVGQYVVLGAGLDSFGLRNPFDDVTVFEVDTPESRAWKLDRLSELGLTTPDDLHHVACDFEMEDFADLLVGAGFDLAAPTVAAWLGVSYYLTAEAIRATLERVGSWPPGTAIVFDYVLAQHRWDDFEGFDADTMRAALEGVAATGEPFISFFDDDELVELCHSCGFGDVELLGHDDIRARYMPGRTERAPGPDPVLKLARAWVGDA
jgi:methyltransferase (TIGR00027 family)